MERPQRNHVRSCGDRHSAVATTVAFVAVFAV